MLGARQNFSLTKQQHFHLSSYLLLILPQQLVNLPASGEGGMALATTFPDA
jgi:hypothetical protein